MINNIKLGFILPKIDNKHHLFGDSIPFEKINPEGFWDSNDLPNEEQNKGYETYNCTGFNSVNIIELYMLKKFSIKVNYSDRWVGIIAGTDPIKGGNDPHTVLEAIRKYGLIPEDMLPFDSNITTPEEYYSFKNSNQAECYAEGQRWLEKYSFLHDWVVTPDMTKEQKNINIKLALQTSPLGMAVYAWAQDDRGIYIKLGSENHWTGLVGYQDYLKAKDSYNPFDKNVEQDILYCKRIYISKNKTTTTLNKESYLGKLLKLFKLK